jgi:metal transporter CNNM
MTPDIFIWIGIVLCVLQSGTFSGLNLALFGIGALELKARARAGNEDAKHLFKLRQDSNFLLATILWGNVGTNVLLTLLTDSVLAGVAGFAFSTFVITFGGEIIPQAYFSRSEQKRILKGADLLGQLFHGIVLLKEPSAK